VAASSDDWFFVIDADEVITEPANLKARLSETELDCGDATLWERTDQASTAATQFHLPAEHAQTIRKFFRAGLGLQVKGNHYTYMTADGRRLWGQIDERYPLEPCLSIPELRILHRNQERALERTKNRKDYYTLRDQLGIEYGECDRCHARDATQTRPSGFTRKGNDVEAGNVVVCDPCARAVDIENEVQLRALGFDPAVLRRVDGGCVTDMPVSARAIAPRLNRADRRKLQRRKV
jgi:hypothetical protein